MNKYLKTYLLYVLIFSLSVSSFSFSSLYSDVLFRRAKTIDPAFSVSAESAETIAEIFDGIESRWDTAKAGKIETLKEILVSEGILSIDDFDNYSSQWLELYLNTVLVEGSSQERVEVVRTAVLLVKDIIEIDDLLNLESNQDLIQCSGLLNLIQSLRRDLMRINFDSLLDEEKEAVLKKVADTLPYEERLLFYVAFQPKLFEKYLEVKQAAKEEAEKLYAQEKLFSISELYPVPQVRMALGSVNLAQLVPQHMLSTDIGVGSSSYQRRLEEIEKGIMAPLVILNLRGFGFAVYEGHARALAALDKGMKTLPAYVITPRLPSMDRITNLTSVATRTGLFTLDDMRLEDLILPEGISLVGLNVPNVIAVERRDNDAELRNHMGNIVMKNIVDSIKEKGRANVLIGIKDLEFLRKALSGHNFFQYIEDWSCVNVFLQTSADMDFSDRDNLVNQLSLIIPGNIPHDNIHLANDSEELSDIIAREEGIDFVISDVASAETDHAVAQTSVSKAKILLVLPNRSEGMLFQEMFFDSEDGEFLTDILDDPENILLTGSDFIRALLPQEVRSSSDIIPVQNLTQISDEIQPIVSDIRSAVTQAEGFNHPALIAIDGWAGAGRDTIIGILKDEFPEYRITTLSLDSYRLSSDVLREDANIPIPEIGHISWSTIGIGIRRDSATNITVVTSFDETTIRLPAVGQEVKVADNAFYVRRNDSGNLNIRLASILKNVELGKFYQAIQDLREGKVVNVPTQGSVEEMDPNEYDIIFIKGGLSLHQEAVNINYSLSLFIDAEFPARIERSIREHIFNSVHSDSMTVSELRNYMEAQRIDLEDQYLFEDRERADYVVINGFYPDETLLYEIYGMNLSERIDQAITVALQDNVSPGWSMLRDYIIPVTGVGGNFRSAMESISILHQEQLKDSPNAVSNSVLLDRIESYDLLDSNEQELLSTVLERIGLMID